MFNFIEIEKNYKGDPNEGMCQYEAVFAIAEARHDILLEGAGNRTFFKKIKDIIEKFFKNLWRMFDDILKKLKARKMRSENTNDRDVQISKIGASVFGGEYGGINDHISDIVNEASSIVQTVEEKIKSNWKIMESELLRRNVSPYGKMIKDLVANSRAEWFAMETFTVTQDVLNNYVAREELFKAHVDKARDQLTKLKNYTQKVIMGNHDIFDRNSTRNYEIVYDIFIAPLFEVSSYTFDIIGRLYKDISEIY